MKNKLTLKTRGTKNLTQEDIDYINQVINKYALVLEQPTNRTKRHPEIALYFTLLNTGGRQYFATYDGQILVDKLDRSYTYSRELVCVSQWNIRKVIRVTDFIPQDNSRIEQPTQPTQPDKPNQDEPTLKTLTHSNLQEVLFTVTKPKNLVYLVYTHEGTELMNPQTLTVNTLELSKLSYADYLACVLDAYNHTLKRKGIQTGMSTDPSNISFTITNYTKEG